MNAFGNPKNRPPSSCEPPSNGVSAAVQPSRGLDDERAEQDDTGGGDGAERAPSSARPASRASVPIAVVATTNGTDGGVGERREMPHEQQARARGTEPTIATQAPNWRSQLDARRRQSGHDADEARERRRTARRPYRSARSTASTGRSASTRSIGGGAGIDHVDLGTAGSRRAVALRPRASIAVRARSRRSRHHPAGWSRTSACRDRALCRPLASPRPGPPGSPSAITSAPRCSRGLRGAGEASPTATSTSSSRRSDASQARRELLGGHVRAASGDVDPVHRAIDARSDLDGAIPSGAAPPDERPNAPPDRPGASAGFRHARGAPAPPCCASPRNPGVASSVLERPRRRS